MRRSRTRGLNESMLVRDLTPMEPPGVSLASLLLPSYLAQTIQGWTPFNVCWYIAAFDASGCPGRGPEKINMCVCLCAGHRDSDAKEAAS